MGKYFFIFILTSFIVNAKALTKEILLDKTAALVGNKIITLTEVVERKEQIVKSSFSDNPNKITNKEVLEKMIEQKLIRQYLEEKEELPTKQEIQNSIDKIKNQYSFSQKDLEEKLRFDGISYETFLEARENDLIFRKFFELELKNRINVTKKDLEEVYQKLYKKNPYIFEYKIKHILIRDSITANEVYKNLKTNIDNFDKLAQQYSIDETTKYSGGDLGYLEEDLLLAELKKALKNMSINDLKGPIATKNGYEIILLKDIKRSMSSDFKEKSNSLRYSLVEQKSQTELRKWVEARKDISYVKIFI